MLHISGIQSQKTGMRSYLPLVYMLNCWLTFLLNCLQLHITRYFIFRYFLSTCRLDILLHSYRHSQLHPFFVMYVQKGCDSPSIAMFIADTIWNARSVKVFLLQHNTPIPPRQFNDTVVRVPKHNLLCSRRGCMCLKLRRH